MVGMGAVAGGWSGELLPFDSGKGVSLHRSSTLK